MFFSVSISGLLSFLLFVSAELLLNNHASTNAVRLAEIIVLCSIAIFISMFLIRVISSRYFFKSRLKVAILGITPAGLAIEQALFKEYTHDGIDITFFEDRAVQRDSRLLSIDKKATHATCWRWRKPEKSMKSILPCRWSPSSVFASS